jgi:prophage regulatory protein
VRLILEKIETMNSTTQSPSNSVHPARQQRILRLPEVKAKTGFGRSTIYALMATDRSAKSACPTTPAHECIVLKAASWMTKKAMNPVWACRLAVCRQST